MAAKPPHLSPNAKDGRSGGGLAQLALECFPAMRVVDSEPIDRFKGEPSGRRITSTQPPFRACQCLRDVSERGSPSEGQRVYKGADPKWNVVRICGAFGICSLQGSSGRFSGGGAKYSEQRLVSFSERAARL